MNGVLTVVLFWILPSLGQWEGSARLEGTGNAGVLLTTGSEALFGNPTGLADKKGWSVTQGYRMPYALPEYVQAYIGAGWASSRYGGGIGIWTQGIGSVYRETHLLIGWAYRIRSWALGIRPRLFMVQANGSDLPSVTVTAILLDWGLTWSRGPLRVGFLQENATHQSIRVLEAREVLPSRWTVALQVERPRSVYWMAAIGPHGRGRIGVESWFTSGFAVRMGVDDRALTIGMGLRSGRFAVDFSGKSHRDLGTSYGVTFRYQPE